MQQLRVPVRPGNVDPIVSNGNDSSSDESSGNDRNGNDSVLPL